jgi:hypothetical protein
MTDFKTVVLSAVDNSNKKAVLNLEKDGEEYTGSLRLYNFKDSPSGILSLGFLIDNKVFTAALTEKSKGLYTFQSNLTKDIEKFSCALINIQGGEPKPLLSGSTEKSNADVSLNLVKNFKYLDDTNFEVKEIEKSLNDCGIDYDDEEKEEIEKVLDVEFKEDNCSKCEYRNAFYNSCENLSTNTQTNFINKIQETKNVYPLNNEAGFYNEIKDQLNILFDKYPEETFLTEVIPNSKWVKVDYEDDGHYIVIGLIYENNKVQYVCYGSPGEFSVTPPREFNGLSQWLPLDIDKPEELGYWIIYQDANTGENVEIKVS